MQTRMGEKWLPMAGRENVFKANCTVCRWVFSISLGRIGGIKWQKILAGARGSPNPQGKPAQHIHLPLDGRTAPGKARAGRRFLGTNGATLWLWSCLPKPGAPGP